MFASSLQQCADEYPSRAVIAHKHDSLPEPRQVIRLVKYIQIGFQDY